MHVFLVLSLFACNVMMIHAVIFSVITPPPPPSSPHFRRCFLYFFTAETSAEKRGLVFAKPSLLLAHFNKIIRNKNNGENKIS